MDVDEENFEAALQLLENALEGAAFVAMDLEMTGIRLDSATEDMRDLPEDRYLQSREVAARHGVVQIGLCIFEEAAHSNGGTGKSYIAYPFNFFVFPRPFNDPPDTYVASKFTLDSDAVHFMRCNSMDFGRWMKHGVPFVDRHAEKQISEAVGRWKPNGQFNQGHPAGLSQKEENQRSNLTNDARSVLSKRDRFDLTGRAPKVQQTVLQDLRRHFPKQHFALERRPGPLGGCRAPAVSLCKLNSDPAQRRLWEQREAQVLDDFVKQQIGFRRAWKALQRARRPLVLHNGFLDLLFAYHWLEEDLPETMEEFQSRLTQAGMDVYDTKWIASYTAIGQEMGHNQRTSLEALCNLLDTRTASKPNAYFHPNFAKYSTGAAAGQFHDAGYDAYCTGRLYAYFLQEDTSRSASSDAPPNGVHAQAGNGASACLQRYKAEQRAKPAPLQGANPFNALECSDDEESSEELEAKIATYGSSQGPEVATVASATNKVFLMFNSWDFTWGRGIGTEALVPIQFAAEGRCVAVRHVCLQGCYRKDWTTELFEIAREHSKDAKDAPAPKLDVRWCRRDHVSSHVMLLPENKSDTNWQDVKRLDARLDRILTVSAERNTNAKGGCVRWDRDRRKLQKAAI